MSLVGTRPILQDELQKYELHHRARIAIKPGITGMWQVSGRSDITDFEEVVRLDTEYISNWNFGLDIKILFKTVMTVLKATMSHECTGNCVRFRYTAGGEFLLSFHWPSYCCCLYPYIHRETG